MAMTFDATLKDMGRESPRGFLDAFDRPPALPVRLLNVDLSTVTAGQEAADRRLPADGVAGAARRGGADLPRKGPLWLVHGEAAGPRGALEQPKQSPLLVEACLP
jgi:hypothetical protein